MSDSVRFYSTEVSPEQSLGEVMKLLRRYGATRFEMLWGRSGVDAVRFGMPTPQGVLAVILRPQLLHLGRELRERHGVKDPEQVQRVAWRQLKGILEGLLMAADTGMFPAGQLFLGMAETPTGESMWEAFMTLEGTPEVILLAPPVIDGEYEVEE